MRAVKRGPRAGVFSLAVFGFVPWLHAAPGSVAGAAEVVDERAIDARTTELTIETSARADRTHVRVLLPQALRPNRRGRLTFTVGLGPPHLEQQFTQAAATAGEGEPGYFVSRSVAFASQ